MPRVYMRCRANDKPCSRVVWSISWTKKKSLVLIRLIFPSDTDVEKGTITSIILPQ